MQHPEENCVVNIVAAANRLEFRPKQHWCWPTLPLIVVRSVTTPWPGRTRMSTVL